MFSEAAIRGPIRKRHIQIIRGLVVSSLSSAFPGPLPQSLAFGVVQQGRKEQSKKAKRYLCTTIGTGNPACDYFLHFGRV